MYHAKREAHAKAMQLTEKRKECNAEILRRLTTYLIANPGMRFNQALSNLDIVVAGRDHHNDEWANDYYLEPEEILKRMK